jgi:hypothetical protein
MSQWPQSAFPVLHTGKYGRDRPGEAGINITRRVKKTVVSRYPAAVMYCWTACSTLLVAEAGAKADLHPNNPNTIG